MAEIITYRQYESYISRCVNATLKKYGRASSNATVSNNCKCIIEVRMDSKTLLVKDNWRDEIRHFSIVDNLKGG
jgi:hypothetical protein